MARRFSLDYRAPFDFDALLAFYRARAIAGVEEVDEGRYRRIARAGGRPVLLTVWQAAPGQLECSVAGGDGDAAAALAARLRVVFDLDTDTAPICARLGRDATLAPLVAAHPGLRVGGAIEAFEQAVRAILGQQISVVAARDLAARLCRRWGEPVRFAGAPQLECAFPTPAALAEADVAALGMPGARGRAVTALARACLATPQLLERGPTLEAAVARLQALPGVGPWSAHYIAMRALREPDAFPASDIGLLRALTGADGVRPSARAASARAEAWRPYRAYAAQYLWTRDAAGNAP